MKNIFLLSFLFFFLLSGNIGFCDYSFSTTEYIPNPTYYQTYPKMYKPKGMYSQRAFNNLERKMLYNNFSSETPSQRLNRMEEATFGAIQSGDEYSRYRALKRAMRENNQQYYSPHHNSLRKRFYNNFRGMPTGFTPPVQSPNYYYAPDYSNYNLQSGMKVKILDY